MSKLRMWDAHKTWGEAENEWDRGAKEAVEKCPNKGLKRLPKMPGITDESARFLKLKALWWMIKKDEGWKTMRSTLKHPIRYGMRYLRSLFKRQSFEREGDFFFYGVRSLVEFRGELEERDTLLVLGFSYCHKPFECPSGRFTADCVHDPENMVCRQCFIGKAIHSLPKERAIPLVIPTVHYIGNQMFDLVHAHPDKKILFIITACEMTLTMFADWGNMMGIRGIGVRLDGRICNTMRAFDLSERGIKPGLTVVLDNTQKKILDLIQFRRGTCRQ